MEDSYLLKYITQQIKDSIMKIDDIKAYSKQSVEDYKKALIYRLSKFINDVEKHIKIEIITIGITNNTKEDIVNDHCYQLFLTSNDELGEEILDIIKEMEIEK